MSSFINAASSAAEGAIGLLLGDCDRTRRSTEYSISRSIWRCLRDAFEITIHDA